MWGPHRVALFDVRLCDTDALSYGNHTVKAVLTRAEVEKKRKYLEACEQRHASFTLLACSVDDFLALPMIAFMAERLVEKWGKAETQFREWLRTQMPFAIIQIVQGPEEVAFQRTS